MTTRVLFFVACLFSILVVPDVAGAQAGLPDPNALGAQNLRGYTHMFLAYAIAWALVMGWIISVGRRLGAVQKNLEQ